MSNRFSLRLCDAVTLCSWTTSVFTKLQVCERPLKGVVPFLSTSRHTVPISTPSNSCSPNSNPFFARLPLTPSRAPPIPSSTFAKQLHLVLTKSRALSVLHTWPIQDMVNLNGKRSSRHRKCHQNNTRRETQF